MMTQVMDPLRFFELYWPDVVFSPEQVETIYSVKNNDETFVPAGNMLGKDFVAAAITLWYFLSRTPCKILTTSVKQDHLKVLWGEIDKFIRICKYPLSAKEGGPLLITSSQIKKVVNGHIHRDSYIIQAVANEQSVESFQGHHVTPDPGQPIDSLPRNLFLCDEASGVPQMYWDMITPWAKRIYVFGNPWPCANFFYHAVEGKPGTDDKGGDIPRPNGVGFERKIIQIGAPDSPNVKLAHKQIAHGLEVTNDQAIPGMITYVEYQKRLRRWDKVKICVSIYGKFYKGAEVLMYPPDWLNHAEELAAKRPPVKPRTMGVDSAEGGDSTVWALVGDLGITKIISMKTPDTSIIPDKTISLINQYHLRPEDVLFDRGGGGYEHVCEIRKRGYAVRSINFGGSPTPERSLGMKILDQRMKEDEIRDIYKNRRAEMYGVLMEILNPAKEKQNPGKGFGIKNDLVELRRQLAPIPKQYDKEGCLVLPPKRKPVSGTAKESNVLTMKDLIGCSPDEADAVVLAVFGLEHKAVVSKAGAAF